MLYDRGCLLERTERKRAGHWRMEGMSFNIRWRLVQRVREYHTERIQKIVIHEACILSNMQFNRSYNLQYSAIRQLPHPTHWDRTVCSIVTPFTFVYFNKSMSLTSVQYILPWFRILLFLCCTWSTPISIPCCVFVNRLQHFVFIRFSPYKPDSCPWQFVINCSVLKKLG